MATLIKCAHCGFEGKVLSQHLRRAHQQTKAEYLAMFPDAETISKETSSQMRESNVLTGTTGTFEERYGEEQAAEIKSKISKNSGKARLGKPRPGQAETIKKVWEEKRTEWTAGIAAAARSPEKREKQRQATRKRIARDGYHLARGKENKLEAFIRIAIESQGYETVRQKGTSKALLNATRFFDLYIPALNLLVECDGEYWHRNIDRILIDEAKQQYAKDEGYKLLRISDSEIKPNKTNPQFIIDLLQLTEEEMDLRASQLIEKRRVKCNA